MDIVLATLEWIGFLLEAMGIAPVAIVAVGYRGLFGMARRFSPGTGMAVGYWRNFLGPVLRSVRDKSELSEVLIWMPKLEDAESSAAAFEAMVKPSEKPQSKPPGQRYENSAVQTQQGTRTILVTDIEDQKVALDLPRTLAPVLDELAQIPAGKLLKRFGSAEALQRRELRNFWDALLNRIRDEGLGSTVRFFEQDPATAHATARPLGDFASMRDRLYPKPNAFFGLVGF